MVFINRAEVVEIRDGKTKGMAGALGAQQFPLQCFDQGAPVQYAGQHVMAVDRIDLGQRRRQLGVGAIDALVRITLLQAQVDADGEQDGERSAHNQHLHIGNLRTQETVQHYTHGKTGCNCRNDPANQELHQEFRIRSTFWHSGAQK